MRVLVTGASGFVGRALVPALSAAGHHVRAAMRSPRSAAFSPNVEVASYHPDMEQDALVALISECDAVVHLAGIAHTGPGIPEESYDQVNHLATVRLARAAAAANVKRFVFVSSIRAQSGPTAEHVLTEESPPRPEDAYGRSKLAAENALRESTLPYVILRPVLVYGPGVKGNMAALVRLAELPVPLPLGGLSARRSLLSIGHLTGAILFTLGDARAIRETFLVTDRSPVTVAEIVAALRRGQDRKPSLVFVPRVILRTLLILTSTGSLWPAAKSSHGRVIQPSPVPLPC
jgi:UDP-glucose 4-epimerase